MDHFRCIASSTQRISAGCTSRTHTESEIIIEWLLHTFPIWLAPIYLKYSLKSKLVSFISNYPTVGASVVTEKVNTGVATLTVTEKVGYE